MGWVIESKALDKFGKMCYNSCSKGNNTKLMRVGDLERRKKMSVYIREKKNVDSMPDLWSIVSDTKKITS